MSEAPGEDEVGAGSDGSTRTVLGLAAVASLCCVGPAAVAGGAAVTGGAASGAMYAGGVVESLGAALVTAVVTAVPLAAAGLVLRWRARRT